VSFGSPYLLLLLLVVPAAAVVLGWLERRRARRAAVWATPALLPNLAVRPPAWRRWLPIGLLLLGATLLLVGFARPKAGVTVGRNQATLVVVLDISGSMAAKDAPPTRLAVARRDIRDLLKRTPDSYRVAAVAFSDHQAVIAPPSRNRTVVLGAISRVHTGPQGTALTDAVLRAVKLAHALPKVDGKRPPATVVVFSDGAANAGRATAAQVVKTAKADHVPVDAVVIGTPSGVVRQKLQGGFEEQIAVPVQPELLDGIARASGGHAYAPTASLEPVVRALRTRTGTEHKTVEVTAAAAGGGLCCMVVAGLVSGLWFRRVP
jgi:Ca-activated chloride channel family protein